MAGRLRPSARLTMIVAAAALLVLCAPFARQPQPRPVLDRAAGQVIVMPVEGWYDFPSWLPDGQHLIAQRRLPTTGPTDQSRRLFLVTVPLDGGPVVRLPVPDDPDCRRTSQYVPRLLPDGRVGFLQSCEGTRTPARRIPEEAVSLLATDVAGETTNRLVPYYLPFGANVFDIAPDQSVGIINDGNGLYERLQWLRPEQLDPLDLPLERAGRPRWSPDSRWIAFGGAAPVPGWQPDSVNRLDLPKQLYRLAVATGNLEVLVEDATWVGLPAWSADGRWLLVGMHVRSGERGLWLVELATRRRVWLLEGGDIGGASWAPDGRSMVVTMEAVPAVEPRDAQPRGLVRYALPPLDSLLPAATWP